MHILTKREHQNVSVQQYKYSLYLGNKLSEKLLEESRKLVKFTNVELEEMIQKYSQRLKKFT